MKVLDLHPRRLLAAYRLATLVVFFVSVGWFAVFAYNGSWPLAIFEVALCVVALVSWFLIRTDRLSTAFLFSEIAFLSLTAMFCLVFDVPSEQVPRVTHLFLLVIAMLAYISFFRGKSWFQLVIVAVCLSFFVFFASNNHVYSFAQPIAEEYRTVGAWVNVIVATALLCLCITIMQAEITRQGRAARELQKAMRSDELEVYYQPVLDRSSTIVGAEALLRWKHPTRGFVSPDEFIRLAEENGMMPALGAWVMKAACRTLADWQDEPALAHLKLGVNVSVEQFKDPSFDRFVSETLEAHGVDPKKLTLELTESVVIGDHGVMVPIMNRMRDTGISFALDDFGTGYSSLSYLRKLPFDTIKIDRSFVHEGLETQRGNALVRSIIQIGRDLGMVVIVEGVETPEQHDALLRLGCDRFQGFLFGRPIPRDEFERNMRGLAVDASHRTMLSDVG